MGTESQTDQPFVAVNSDESKVSKELEEEYRPKRTSVRRRGGREVHASQILNALEMGFLAVETRSRFEPFLFSFGRGEYDEGHES